MYNYLKNCIQEAAKEALGEKEVSKGRKIFVGMQKWKKKDKIRKKYF